MKALVQAKIITNSPLATDGSIFDLVLEAPEIAGEAKPGQFINIYLDDQSLILPRPLSICEIRGNRLRIVYQQVGKGTKCLTQYQPGESLRVLGPLGNGFPVYEMGYKKIAVIGGGIGVPPLLQLTRALKENNPACEIHVINGFRTGDMVILEREFEATGAQLHTATDDGSQGYHGNVLDCLKNLGFLPDAIFACGPGVMLKHISAYAEEHQLAACHISMEERMACGLGACVGCSVKLKKENEAGWAYGKVCKDGPVFDSREVVWE